MLQTAREAVDADTSAVCGVIPSSGIMRGAYAVRLPQTIRRPGRLETGDGWRRGLLLCLALSAAPVAAQPPATAAAHAATTQRLAALVPRMQQHLDENILPFWFPRSVDVAHGGYIINYAHDGTPLPGGTKMIVSQARQLWLASRLLRRPGHDPRLREAADHGFRFLRDRMWDATHGGFFWALDPTGREVQRADKHLYGQAFGLYALSEYARATGSVPARALADTLFGLLEQHAWDRRFGGYREFFQRDWSTPPPDARSPLGSAPDVKLMNTHLHLMEALTAYVDAGAGVTARQRLADLVAIETQAVVRLGWTACTDVHERDWTPVLDAERARVSYGHDLENIWLVADALRALDRPTAPYRGLFRALFAYAATYGEDRDAGGFYDSGPPQAAADRRTKIWWVQAEALVSALTMYQLTGEVAYLETFERVWRWIDRHQTDWASGEWHEAITPEGTPRAGNKAHAWKAGYHNGRALIEAIERITAMQTR